MDTIKTTANPAEATKSISRDNKIIADIINSIKDDLKLETFAPKDIIDEIKNARDSKLGYHDMIIGTTKLFVPPESLTVSDLKNNYEIQPIRTEQNLLVKSGHAFMTFNLDLTFTGKKIDSQLRNIIAQYRACPFSTITSQYLNDLVTNTKKPDQSVKLANLNIRQKQVVSQIRNLISEINKSISITLSKNDGDRFLLEQQLILIDEDIKQLEFVKAKIKVEFVIRSIGAISESTRNKFSARLRSLIVAWGSVAEELSSIKPQEAVSQTFPIPVVFKDLSVFSIPDLSNTVGCNIQFILFNHTPYTNGNLLWKDNKGSKTINMYNAAVFQKYYIQRFIPKENFSTVPTAEIIKKRLLITGKIGLNNIEAVSREILGKFNNNKPSSFLRLTFPTEKVINNKRVYADLVLDSGSIGSMTKSIAGVISNRLSVQNVQSGIYPTVQYMGGKTGRFVIELHVTDKKILNEINYMRRSNDASIHDVKARKLREDRIFIENNILNMLGFYAGQIVKIQETPETAGESEKGIGTSTLIRIEFQEFRTSPATDTVPPINFLEDDQIINKLIDFIKPENIKSVLDIDLSKEKQNIIEASASVRILNQLDNTIFSSTFFTEILLKSKSENLNRNIQKLIKNTKFFKHINTLVELFVEDRAFKRFLLDTARNETKRIKIIKSIFGFILNKLILSGESNFIFRTSRKIDPIIKTISKQILSEFGFVTINFTDFTMKLSPERDTTNLVKTNYKTFRDFDPETFIFFKDGLMSSLNIKFIENKNSSLQTNYPDLVLPRYCDFYPKLTNLIHDSISSENKNDLNSIKSKPARELLSFIFPRFIDLGKQPPFNINEVDLYKNPNDRVEPDFFFFNDNSLLTNPDIQPIPRAEIANSATPKSDDGSSVSRASDKNAGQSTKIGKDVSTGGNPSKNKIKPKGSSPTLTPLPTTPASITEDKNNAKKRKTIFFRRRINQSVADQSHGLPFVKRVDIPKRLAELTRSQYIKSAGQWVPRMAKAYPTYHFYFIFEGIFTGTTEGSTRSRFKARVTIPNALISLSVFRHKRALEIAELELMNKAGNLDNEQFKIVDFLESSGTQTKWKGIHPDPDNQIFENRSEIEFPFKNPKEIFKKKFSKDPLFLQKKLLKEGTRIVIKLGYATLPDDLQTVFTGYIAEVIHTDIISLVCQSYAAGLTIPIMQDSIATSLAGVARDVVGNVLRNSETQFLGRLTKQNILNVGQLELNSIEFSQKKRESRKKQVTIDSAAAHNSVGAFIVSKLINGESITNNKIPLRDKKTNRLKSFIQDVVEDPIQGIFSDKGIPSRIQGEMFNVFLPTTSAWEKATRGNKVIKTTGRTGLSIIDEMTRREPGMCWYVVPYDEEARLFVGKPDNLYISTSKFPRQFEVKGKTNNAFERELEFLRQRQTSRKKVTDDIKDLFIGFMKSDKGLLFRKIIIEEAFTDSSEELQAANNSFIKTTLRNIGDKTFSFVTGADIKPFSLINIRIQESLRNQQRAAIKKLSGIDVNQDIIPFVNNIQSKLGQLGLQLLLRFEMNFISLFERPFKPAESVSQSLRDKNFKIRIQKQFLKKGVALLKTVVSSSGLGNILSSVQNWKDTEYNKIILGPNPNFNRDRLRIRLFSLNEDDSGFFKVFGSIGDEASKRTEDLESIPEKKYRAAVDLFLKFLFSWRAFQVLFSEFLSTIKKDKLKEIVNRLQVEDNKNLDLNPRLLPFRSVHAASSFTDIIDNDIVATKSQMANSVILQYNHNDDNWETITQSLNVVAQDRTVRLNVEDNIYDLKLAAFVSDGLLGEALRPMYRGNLLMRGSPLMKPYDIIYLQDFYNLVYGPVEVEQVVHKLNIQEGYISEVIPCAFVNVYNNSNIHQNEVFSFITNTIALTIGIGLAASGSPFIGGLVGMTIKKLGDVKVAIDREEQEIILDSGSIMPSVYGQLLTNSGINVNDNPIAKNPAVQVIPLIKFGNKGWRPWTSGMRGKKQQSWFTRLNNRWEDLGTGINDLYEGLWDNIDSDAFIRKRASQLNQFKEQ